MYVQKKVYGNDRINRLFPAAPAYQAIQERSSPSVREANLQQRRFPYSERHLQCLWHDQKLRPRTLKTLDGEDVLVEHAGVWNLEAGPDFMGAALRIGPDLRRISGDVEIHISPSGWHAHGHDSDPRYQQVRVHVTWFPGTPDPSIFPAGTIHIALKEFIQVDPFFSFEAIDTTAYPYAIRENEVPCTKLLKNWPPEQKLNLLTAAGQERIRRKAERLALAIEEKGEEQVLYEELMCALGYKNNKTPFRQLARCLPVDILRKEAGDDPLVIYALLAGVSGLLPSQPHVNWPDDTRIFVRQVWDHWWKRREEWGSRIIPHKQWQLSGIRPVNHPLRRMMVPALLLTSSVSLPDLLHSNSTAGVKAFIKRSTSHLTTLADSYWIRHLSLKTDMTDTIHHLIGKQRASAIISNVYIPFLAATQQQVLFTEGILNALPGESKNALIRQTAHTLFGRDHNSKLYNKGLLQQGLLQIFHDFCLNDRSRCTRCPLPPALQHHQEQAGWE